MLRLAISLIFVCLVSISPVCAQSNFCFRFWHIYDDLTHVEMDRDSLQVTVMEADSSVIKKDISFNDFEGLWFKKRPLLVKIHQTGFIPQTINIPKPGNRIDYLNMIDPIIMKRKPNNRVRQLDEITVTASNIKMINRGDTVIYNAEAFQLSQGSMLDELIRNLPNVELRNGGQIFVNGQFVESLLLNGKDFFKGNPMVALSNLPSYTVKNVKVYEQAKGMARLDPTVKKPLVMDVNLKKEYMRGWIANAEAGYGSSDRYLGRLFGLMFTPLQRLTIYGNANNTNDSSTPDEGEQWNPDWLQEGQSKIILGGIDHLVSDKQERWEANTTVEVSHENNRLSEDGFSEMYADSDSLNTSDTSRKHNKSLSAGLSHSFKYDYGLWSVWVEPNLRYSQTDNETSSSSEMFNFANKLNSNNRENTTSSKTINGDMTVTSNYSIPNTPDIATLQIKGSFLQKRSDQHGRLTINYADNPLSNVNRIYTQKDPSDQWNLQAMASYYARFYINNNPRYTTKLSAKYIFSHNSDNTDRRYYQFDVFDSQNSFNSHEITDTHELDIMLSQYFGHNISITINPHVKFTRRHLDYWRFDTPYYIERRNFYADPTVECSCKPFNIAYNLKNDLPGLYNMLDIIDGVNPLYIKAGNASLRSAVNHRITLRPKFLEKLLHSSTYPTVTLSYTYTDNAFAWNTDYDTSTGITTIQPTNINGCWNLTGRLNMGYYLDKSRSWLLSNNTNYRYNNTSEIVNKKTNKVKLSTLTEKLTLSWDSKFGVQFKAFGSLEWHNANALTNPFSTNIFNIDYGLTIAAPDLPWDISVKSDFAVHSRRGYANYDDNRLVWNMRLSKSLLHGNLIVMLDGYDILGQLSNIVIDVTPQGRTEARYNTLPRYAMLHVIYRLNIQPKKK